MAELTFKCGGCGVQQTFRDPEPRLAQTVSEWMYGHEQEVHDDENQVWTLERDGHL